MLVDLVGAAVNVKHSATEQAPQLPAPSLIQCPLWIALCLGTWFSCSFWLAMTSLDQAQKGTCRAKGTPPCPSGISSPCLTPPHIGTTRCEQWMDTGHDL